MKTLCLSLTLLCAVAAQADPWRVTYGTWGGYTGGGGGMELRSDGSLFSLKADVPSRNVRTFRGQVEESDLKRIHALALAAQDTTLREQANMTTRLVYEGEKRYAYSWEIGRKDLPQPIVDWISALTSLEARPVSGPQWDGESDNEAGAELILSGEEAVLRIAVGTERKEFRFSEKVSKADDLAGKTSGPLEIAKVEKGWIEGSQGGLPFRLPLWTER